MGLRGKMFSGFLILVLMLFAAGGMSLFELSHVGRSVQDLLDENYRSVKAAQAMQEALEREDSGMLLLLLGKWEEGRKTIREADLAFAREFEAARSNLTLPGEEALVNEIQEQYREYKALWARPVVGTPHEGNLAWYFNEVHGAFLRVKAGIEKLAAQNDGAMYDTATRVKERATRAVMPGIVAMVAAVVFSLVFIYFIQAFVVNPILALTRGIRANLDNGAPLNVTIHTRDELAELARSIQDLLARHRAGGK